MSEEVAREFLTRVLDHDPIQPGDLAAILGLKENHFLDFKEGPFASLEKARQALRRHISGFANADGGVLVLGVGDRIPRAVTGIETWLNDAEDWVNRVTASLLPTMGAAPACKVIEIQGHQILVVGVDRGASLTSCIEGGESSYYMRSGDSTFKMRESLIGDLILGRRRGPRMEIVRAYFDCNPPQDGRCQLQFGLSLENHSFGFASDLTVGLVTWALALGDYRQPNAELVRTVEPITPRDTNGRFALWQLRPTAGNDDPVVRPFGPTLHVPMSQRVWVPDHPAEVGAAIFVAPRDCPTQWFQGAVAWPGSRGPGPRHTVTLETERLHRTRPKVKWVLQ